MAKVLVLRTAGVNCDEETAHAFRLAGGEVSIRHVGSLLRGEDALEDFDILAIPGGFSYGDDLGAGTVLANQLRTRLADDLHAFIDEGKLVIGICNGFQVLVKTGLLPGARPDGTPRHATLTWNDSHRYEDRWVHLSVDPGLCVFAPKGRELLHLPVAHGEGRFTVADEGLIDELVERHQAVFRYIDTSGATPEYPENPNGSMGHVAGICDPTGQVLGLMPHPERALFPWHHPAWTREPKRDEGDGASLFRAAVQAMR